MPRRRASSACVSFAAVRARTSASINLNSSSIRAVLLPEFRVFHEAFLQVLQFRHGVTCFMRSLAVASARRGVLCDFFAKTRSTTTRCCAAVT